MIARDGEQVGIAWRGSRFVADGSAIRDQGQPHTKLSLIEAELRLAKLTVEVAEVTGQPLWHVLAPEAVSLERAIREARRVQVAQPVRWKWPSLTGARG